MDLTVYHVHPANESSVPVQGPAQGSQYISFRV